jgi:D-sedoheptulose 7-phosphate isomerase
LRERVAKAVQQAVEALQAITPEHQEVIAQMAGRLVEALRGGGKILVCGNGGSAADAQHIAGELVGRFRRDRKPLACLALSTDTSIITAVGNDYAFGDIFSRQVDALGRGGDVLLALTTSGNSPNVLAAARAARARGMIVLAMTGRSGGALAGLAELGFMAPADRADLAQQLHQVAYHIICDLVEEAFAKPPKQG